MKFQERIIDETVFFAVQEERLDVSNVDVFKSGVVDFIYKGHDRFILDLTSVHFMDSRALGVLISIKKSLREQGCFCILCPNKNVRNIFAITRLDRVFHMFSSEQEALAEAARVRAEERSASKKENAQ